VVATRIPDRHSLDTNLPCVGRVRGGGEMQALQGRRTRTADDR
jgi:hypothetical protein